MNNSPVNTSWTSVDRIIPTIDIVINDTKVMEEEREEREEREEIEEELEELDELEKEVELEELELEDLEGQSVELKQLKYEKLFMILQYEIEGILPSRNYSLRNTIKDLNMELECLNVKKQKQRCIQMIQEYYELGYRISNPIQMDKLNNFRLCTLRLECYSYECVMYRSLNMKHPLDLNIYHNDITDYTSNIDKYAHFI
jgi:vacuolar-type H+-ATPase subunit I/STV1